MTSRIGCSALTRRALLGLVSAAALAGCGNGTTEVAARFSQADLTGSWDLVQISTNDGPGWYVASITVAADGRIAVTSNLDSAGNGGLPPPGFDARLTVDAAGNVALGGADGNPSFHGTLASSKTLMVATNTSIGVGSYQFMVVRKRVPSVTFGPSDVASFPFALHTLRVGNSIAWEVGAGATDASGQITVTSLLDSLGNTTTPPPSFDTLQVDANGLLTTANDTTFHGVMTPDKNAIFAVSTTDVATPQTHQLLVILRTGQTFAAADLASDYAIHSLGSGATAAASSWNRGTVTIGATGQVTFTSYLTSSGSTNLPTGVTFAFDPATGIITRPADPTFHGRLAWGKDFYARVSGSATTPSLAITVR